MQFSRPLAKQQHANISWNYEKMAADASEPTEQSLGTTDRWHHFTYHWLTHQWWQCGWTCIAWTALWRLCHCQFVRMLSNIHFFLGPLLIGIPSHWLFASRSRFSPSTGICWCQHPPTVADHHDTPAVTGGLHPLLDIAPKNRRSTLNSRHYDSKAYAICDLPFCSRPSSKITWRQCDRWCHNVCVGYPSPFSADENASFLCNIC